MLKFLLYFVVVAHFVALVGNIASVVWLLVYAPWYVCFPAITFIVDLAVNNWKCPLTILENKLRKKLGMNLIGGFIGYYILGKRALTTPAS